jgi:hypothetical protein
MPQPEPSVDILEPVGAHRGLWRRVEISDRYLDVLARWSMGRRGPVREAAWPALLAPDALAPRFRDAFRRGLTVYAEYRWADLPAAGAFDASVEIVGARPVSGHVEMSVACALASRVDGRPLATGLMTVRLPHEQAVPLGSVTRPPLPAPGDPPEKRWEWTITDDDASDFSRITDSTHLPSAEFGWARYGFRPQAVLSSTLLACEVVGLEGRREAGRAQCWYRRPLLAGSALRWTATGEGEGQVRLTAAPVATGDVALVAVVHPGGCADLEGWNI